jgi:hypothetical protein
MIATLARRRRRPDTRSHSDRRLPATLAGRRSRSLGLGLIGLALRRRTATKSHRTPRLHERNTRRKEWGVGTGRR